MELIWKMLQDGLFAAIAAIGFSAISRPPKQAFLWCALIAATGHSFRFLLMSGQHLHIHIVIATTLASFLIGVMAVLLSPKTKVTAETYLFPALLPMIPGIYAYKTFVGLIMCMYNASQDTFNQYLYLFASNGLTCFFILLGMAIGATIPIFMLKKISFQATRHKIRF